MVRLAISRQSKSALLFSCVIMIAVGGGITVTGFIFEFHGIYEKISDPKPVNAHHVMYPHTQYWLGMPLFLLALYVLLTTFYSSSILHIIGLLLCSFFMVASICAVGLQCTIWYISLNLASMVYSLQCTDTDTGCVCSRHVLHHASEDKDDYETLLSLMTCSQVKHFPTIVSALVILSALAYLVCQTACVVYVKTLRWLDSSLQDEAMAYETTSQHVLLNEHSM